MTTKAQRNSAKIYRFPAGGRAALGRPREGFKRNADVLAPRIAKAASGSGWYHEAAINEAEQNRKR